MEKTTIKSVVVKKVPSQNAPKQATDTNKVVTNVENKTTQQNVNKQDLDLDKLSHAVAFAETGHCKDGTAIKRNNCFGIMQWDKKGNRSPRYFKTQEEGFEAFKLIWKKSYKKFPDINLAIKWTGNDSPKTWLKNVTTYYNTH